MPVPPLHGIPTSSAIPVARLNAAGKRGEAAKRATLLERVEAA